MTVIVKPDGAVTYCSPPPWNGYKDLKPYMGNSAGVISRMGLIERTTIMWIGRFQGRVLVMVCWLDVAERRGEAD